jgi:predicted ATP-dependent endonuclease of OLD family
MKLGKMRIQNYRQFHDVSIEYNDGLTILAGANNSGKTSLVELYKSIFIHKEQTLDIRDLPIQTVHKQVAQIADYLKVQEWNDSEDLLSNFNSILNDIESKFEYLPSDLIVDISVTHDEDENISLFSDYLMELDPNCKKFFFRYSISVNPSKLIKLIKENEIQLKQVVAKCNNSDSDKAKVSLKYLHTLIHNYMDKSINENVFFCNSNFSLLIPMSISSFKNLFNFSLISATRDVNDQKDDKHFSISKEMLSILSLNKDWDTLIAEIPDKISEIINNGDVKISIEEGSISALQETINELSDSTDGNVGSIQLNVNIEEDDIMQFFTRALEAEYSHGDITLSESSLGLGFSNWIYIYLKIEKFSTKIKPGIINFFIIEEPEAHMHPQMQRALVKHIESLYKKSDIQGIITSHSHELVRSSQLDRIRVIRQFSSFKNYIYDMNVFKSTLKTDEEQNFFNLLFSINYSDLIFASKIIMYEGDTEKLYIEALLKSVQFKKLSSQYISFVQVGGAYAHNYQKLLSYLGIKTLIFTDADYSKNNTEMNNILIDSTTNGAIKSYYKDGECNNQIAIIVETICINCPNESIDCIKNTVVHKRLFKYQESESCTVTPEIDNFINSIKNKDITMKTLYDWIQDEENQIIVKFQGIKDKYTRTLEEAMLCKFLDIELCTSLSRSEWEKIRTDNKFVFSIPAKDEEEKEDSENEKSFNIRHIVASSSNRKADFMYSVILNKREIDMLPCYIKEGLEWLQN